ncbi:MAG: hypothetical protein KatS3mg008_2195 [Acidimicrobiales bacterium]|nr:MAG: hypothetical protein KatS3mg008_2195 [Acidimicrobiales bacterium]
MVVPAENLVIPPGGGGGSDVGLALVNATMGAIFVGLAQAAFDVAIEFVRERRQGGRLLADHQLTRFRLFEMDRKIRCARALARAAIVRAATVGPDLAMSVGAKVTSTQTAFEVAHEAVQLHGGAGLTREHLPEKLLRDARASLIEDGSNEVLGLIVGERLVAQ